MASNEDLKIEPSSKRFYPYNETAAHIIGYVGKASKLEILNNEIAVHSGIVGKNGLEKFYNSKLQGELGYKDVKVNALNQEIEVLEEKDASIIIDGQTCSLHDFRRSFERPDGGVPFSEPDETHGCDFIKGIYEWQLNH